MNLEGAYPSKNEIDISVSKYAILPNPHEMQVFETIARNAHNSKMYNSYGGESGIMMTILAARELGIPPMLAINGGINNIQGKLEISARLMNAMMRKNGISIQILESTDDKCIIKGTRDNGDNATVSYTIADAQKAGLIKEKGGWLKNPKDMCFARAISRLARQIAPDIIGGCYVEGEIRSNDVEVLSSPISIASESPDNTIQEREEFEKLLELFDTQDKHHLMEYLDVVTKHFGWSQSKTVKEFLKDTKNLFDKFNAWKGKVKIT